MMSAINVTWWNLQNLFDTVDDPISNDFHYTEDEGWTEELFEAKKTNIVEALIAIHGGAGHDVLAVAEIERDEILGDIIGQLGNPDLRVVEDKTGTRDLRGIDVAMAYNKKKLTLVSRESHLVHLRYRTRDVFSVEFEVKDTGETLIVMASHWPSRRMGRYRSEPLRIAVAEHISYLVESWVKVEPQQYEQLRAQDDLDAVREEWETNVVVLGDFNDEPGDRSVVEHLRASNDLDRVRGETNDIDAFEKQTAYYRAQEVFLFNSTWRFLPQRNVGTYFLSSLRSGEKLTNRYQVLDQLVASRGLVSGSGLTLDIDSVAIFRDPLVATGSGRPRGFNWKTKKGTSDHLPLTAVLRY